MSIEYVKIQLTTENIKIAKSYSSLSKTFNSLIELVESDKKLQHKLNKIIKSKNELYK